MIRHSTPDDLSTIMSMIDHSRSIMRANGNKTQWDGYPTTTTILDDIAKRIHYIIEDNGTPLGCFTLLNQPEPTYARIEGGLWLDDTTPYRTIHRLACAPNAHGIARQAFIWSEQHASSIRVDTHSDNHIMLHIIQQLGYTHCGTVYMDNGTPRLAFQKMMYPMVNPELKAYIESEILPRYNHFDTAHDLVHVQRVMAQSMELAQYYPKLKKDMVYTIAAYHDTGMVNGRENHHTDSARIIRQDAQLRKWFDPIDILIMAQAAEDHRASALGEPRSLYGKIVAEADRDIEPLNIVRRTVQYGLAYYPKLGKVEQWHRAAQHLTEKYGPDGYVKLYIPQSRNRVQLDKLQTLLADNTLLTDIITEMINQYSS